MKKFIFSALLTPLILILSILSALSSPVRAAAEDCGYACILGDNVYLYETESDSYGLFILPESYYVHVLSTGVGYSYVEYLSDGISTRRIRGYCKTSQLTFVDYVPVCPYLYCTLEVTYYIEDAGNVPSDDDFLYGITVSCAYYGKYTIGSKTYCYVLRDGKFGYIPMPSDFSYERNREYEEYISSLEPDEPVVATGEPEKETGMAPAQIAILVLLCILVPVLAALILRPSKRRPFDPEE